MTFSEFADIVTVVSGIMTVIGIGGILSWGFSLRGRIALADQVVTIFAYSLKTAFLLLLFTELCKWIPGWHWSLLFQGGIGFINQETNIFWSSENPIPYLFSYFILLTILVPLCVITVVCVYTSSLRPIVQVGRSILRLSNK